MAAHSAYYPNSVKKYNINKYGIAASRHSVFSG